MLFIYLFFKIYCKSINNHAILLINRIHKKTTQKSRKMKIYVILLLTIVFALTGCQKKKTEIHIIETTDVHGHIFNYDFARDTFRPGSLMQLSAYLKKQDRNNLLLLDNGDIIQGDPVVYYANYVDTTGEHLLAKIFGDLKYDAATIGNHDI